MATKEQIDELRVQLSNAQLAVKQLFVELETKCSNWGVTNTGLMDLDKAEKTVIALSEEMK